MPSGGRKGGEEEVDCTGDDEVSIGVTTGVLDSSCEEKSSVTAVVNTK